METPEIANHVADVDTSRLPWITVRDNTQWFLFNVNNVKTLAIEVHPTCATIVLVLKGDDYALFNSDAGAMKNVFTRLCSAICRGNPVSYIPESVHAPDDSHIIMYTDNEGFLFCRKNVRIIKTFRSENYTKIAIGIKYEAHNYHVKDENTAARLFNELCIAMRPIDGDTGKSIDK